MVDTILNGNVFATRMLGRAKKFVGERMKFPIKYQKNTTGTSFTGFDTLPTGATSNRVNLEFPSANYQITAALPFDELAANWGNDTKIIDLVAVELEGAAHDMTDDIGTLFYSDKQKLSLNLAFC